MQKDRFNEIKKYVQDHKSIQKQLIDFGMLVLKFRMEEDHLTIEELESMPIDDIH